MMNLETWELLSYIVTVFGLPLAIFAFVIEQRKERENEEEEVYQLLSDAYTDFLKLVIDNPDLRLRSQTGYRESGENFTVEQGSSQQFIAEQFTAKQFTQEQQERKLVMFEILISLFERAYLLAYEEKMTGKQLRRWRSWEDYMGEWCAREDFRQLLPRLLQGEDPDFSAHILSIAHSKA